jgi:hypothetical protein
MAIHSSRDVETRGSRGTGPALDIATLRPAWATGDIVSKTDKKNRKGVTGRREGGREGGRERLRTRERERLRWLR